MNYSTIKKVVAFSLLCVLGISAANAQSASTSSSAKVFGGRAQYRTWNLGINAGVLAPVVIIGGSNDFRYWDTSLGYGLTLRKQLGHAFGLELSGVRGQVAGNNNSGETTSEKAADQAYITSTDRISFDTDLDYSMLLSGVVNVATADFLKRENNVNFLVKAGYGVAWYAPEIVRANNAVVDWRGKAGDPGENNTYIKEQVIPVGAGIKFKISDRVNFDLAYTMNFVDGDNFDLTYAKSISKDKYSYTSAGIEFSLGSSAKPNLDWVNPVALMYDELMDPTLRQELEALKGRVSALENTVNQLSQDSDGDGVSNRFDKCPGTPAGVQVDGAGCPINFPPPYVPPTQTVVPTPGGYPNIQFDFDSSVLKTSSYATLDRLSADMRGTSGSATLEGHASSEGTDEYNMNLSNDRANSVKTYLVNSGVAANRINVSGFGERVPLASNATEEGRVVNRRVEIKK